MPFRPGALISRSLWIIFIGEWGVWTHATLPIDDRLDMPDKENITGLCDLIGSLIRPPLCHDDEKARGDRARSPGGPCIGSRVRAHLAARAVGPGRPALFQEPGENLCRFITPGPGVEPGVLPHP
jgi:hypothetical protein